MAPIRLVPMKKRRERKEGRGKSGWMRRKTMYGGGRAIIQETFGFLALAAKTWKPERISALLTSLGLVVLVRGSKRLGTRIPHHHSRAALSLPLYGTVRYIHNISSSSPSLLDTPPFESLTARGTLSFSPFAGIEPFLHRPQVRRSLLPRSSTSLFHRPPTASCPANHCELPDSSIQLPYQLRKSPT